MHLKTFDETHSINNLSNQSPKSGEVCLFRLGFFSILKYQVEIILSTSTLFHKEKFANIFVCFLEIMNEVINISVLVILIWVYNLSNEDLVFEIFNRYHCIETQMGVLFFGNYLIVLFTIFVL